MASSGWGTVELTVSLSGESCSSSVSLRHSHCDHLLLHNSTSTDLAASSNSHLSHSFHGSGAQAGLSWRLCRAAVNVSGKAGFSSEARRHNTLSELVEGLAAFSLGQTAQLRASISHWLLVGDHLWLPVTEPFP